MPLTKAGTESDLIREWAEVNYVPGDRNWSKDAVTPRRYLAIRVRPRQAELLVCGSKVRHFAVVTNRSDPDGGSGLETHCFPLMKLCDYVTMIHVVHWGDSGESRSIPFRQP